MKTNWSTKHRSRSRHPLGDALEGVRSGLVALEARVALNPLLGGLAGVRPQRSAPVGRLREILDRDRALVAAGAPLAAPLSVPPPELVPEPVSAPRVAPLELVPEPAPTARTPAPVGAFATPETSAPASAAPRAQGEAPSPAVAPSAEEPIRTRTMARLLAAQGHRARALAIYDALMAADPDPDLRAEAQRLRDQES